MAVDDHYRAVRENVGMFDFSSLSKFFISGVNATDFLDFILPCNVRNLNLNEIIHTAILDKDGRLIDAIYLYRFLDSFLILGNPSQKEKTKDLFEEYKKAEVNISDSTEDYSIISFEGPFSFESAKKIIGFDVFGLGYLRFIETNFQGISEVICSRTGVTGEYGYRIIVPRDAEKIILSKISEDESLPPKLEKEVLNVLCQEVRFPYFNAFVEEGDNVLEVGLHWFIDFRKEKFLAKDAIESTKSDLNKHLVGFRSDGNVDDLKGKEVYVEDEKIGYVKSCVYSPTLESSIGFAMLKEEWAVTGIDAYRVEKEIQIQTLSTPHFMTKSVITPIS